MLPVTPFQEQLATNYVPNKEETTTIQNLINEVEPQLISLDAEIEAMKARRTVLASFVDEHRALLSPIRQMPPDILRSIFSYCLPYDAPEKVMVISEAPILLTQVCSHWRNLALKTPTLWSTIFLKVPMPPRSPSSFTHGLPGEFSDLQIDIEAAGTSEELFALQVQAWCRKVESLANVTKLWLSRAESCPLTIFFRDAESHRHPGPSTPTDEDFTNGPINALTLLICARSSQWAKLDIQTTESGPIEATFLSQDPSHLPQLQSIRMHWSRRETLFHLVAPGHFQPIPPETPEVPSLNSMKAPRLRSISLINLSGSIKDIPVVWSNLTELSYIGSHRGFTSSAALSLLRNCPNLVQCSLDIMEYPSHDIGASSSPFIDLMEPSERVHLAFLQRLIISESKQGTPLTLFNSLDLPVLTSTTLSVSPPHVGSDQRIPRLSLEPLLLRSSASSGHLIQHLEIGSLGFAMSVGELVEGLKMAEGVKELTINLSKVDPPGGLRMLLPQVQVQPIMVNGVVGPGPFAANDQPPPPPPFWRDGFLNGLAEGGEVCPRLEVLRLTLVDPSDVTTKAVKNLVARRGVVSSLHNPGTLQQVWIRFTLGSHVTVGSGPGMRNGNRTPVFPKRWREEELNAGFNGTRVIWVERRKAVSQYLGMGLHYHPGGHEDGMHRIPFETLWDSDSGRYERCF
jgi:F-box-like